MDVMQILILALVQALTEFLPVSSSGHLVLASYFFGWNYQGLDFDVALHVGTLLAVVCYFWRDLSALATDALRWRPGGTLTDGQRLALGLAIGTIPAGLAGLLLGEQGALMLRQPAVIACMLIGFGLLLWIADRRAARVPALEDYRAPAQAMFGQLPWLTALLVGCAQALALIPGTSRSGVTMTAALLLGLSRGGAARYTFLLSVPILILAGAHGVWELARGRESIAPVDFILGMTVSALAGIVVIHLFLRLLRQVGMLPFVVYRVLLGTGILAWLGLAWASNSSGSL